MWCPFLPGKNSAPMENIPGNTPAQGGCAQPRSVAQGLAGTQVVPWVHPRRLSPPTATSSGQQGSFPPFKVSGMWLKGLRPKWGYKPVSPHPPAPSRGPEPGTTPGPLPPPQVAGPALVTCLCVPQPHQIIFQEFV